MPGRKPKPTQLRVIQGNPGKRALPKREPKPELGAPDRPIPLHGHASAAWKLASEKLQRVGVLTELDGLALAALALSFQDFMQAREALARPVYEPCAEASDALAAVVAEAGSLSYVSATNSGVIMRSRPEVAVIADADRRLRAWLTEFGMTPSARSRVHAVKPEDTDEDVGQKFFG